MQTVCCGCRRTKKQAGWRQGQTGREDRISHGYCPDCFRRTMEQAQDWLLAKNARNHDRTLGQ